MTTIREQITASIASTITAVPSLGAAVFRSRTAAAQRQEGAIVIVEPVSDDRGLGDLISKFDWMLTVNVTVIAYGLAAETTADPIVEKVFRAIMTDRTVSGLAYNVEPQSTSFDFVHGDNDAVVVTCGFTVWYRSSQDDLSVL